MNSLPKTVTRQRRGCDLNPGPSAPESSTLTTRLPEKRKKLKGKKTDMLRSIGEHSGESVGSAMKRKKKAKVVTGCYSTGSKRPHRCCSAP